MNLISALHLVPSATLLHYFVMAVANPKLYSIKQARSHSLPDDQVSLDEIFDTKNCGKCSKLVKKDAKVICCKFCVTLYHTQCANISDEIYELLRIGGDQIHWYCKKYNDQAMNFIKTTHELNERNQYLYSSWMQFFKKSKL